MACSCGSPDCTCRGFCSCPRASCFCTSCYVLQGNRCELCNLPCFYRNSVPPGGFCDCFLSASRMDEAPAHSEGRLDTDGTSRSFHARAFLKADPGRLPTLAVETYRSFSQGDHVEFRDERTGEVSNVLDASDCRAGATDQSSEELPKIALEQTEVIVDSPSSRRSPGPSSGQSDLDRLFSSLKLYDASTGTPDNRLRAIKNAASPLTDSGVNVFDVAREFPSSQRVRPSRPFVQTTGAKRVQVSTRPALPTPPFSSYSGSRLHGSSSPNAAVPQELAKFLCRSDTNVHPSVSSSLKLPPFRQATCVSLLQTDSNSFGGSRQQNVHAAGSSRPAKRAENVASNWVYEDERNPSTRRFSDAELQQGTEDKKLDRGSPALHLPADQAVEELRSSPSSAPELDDGRQSTSANARRYDDTDSQESDAHALDRDPSGTENRT